MQVPSRSLATGPACATFCSSCPWLGFLRKAFDPPVSAPTTAVVSSIDSWQRVPAAPALWSRIVCCNSCHPPACNRCSQAVLLTGLLAAILCFIAAGVRCITTTNPTATYLIHLGQIINGIAGPVESPVSSLLYSLSPAPSLQSSSCHSPLFVAYSRSLPSLKQPLLPQVLSA